MQKPDKLGTYIALGLSFGVVLGLLTENMVMGIALGPLFAIVAYSLRRRKDDGMPGHADARR